MTVIRVGTRQSKLALTQTKQVVEALKGLNPGIDFQLVPYNTTGDKLVHVSLQEIGGKGVFVKDIERALIAQEIDMAVHSLKDVPALLAEGCVIGAIPEREDVRDCLIFREAGLDLDNLPSGSVVGTSSQRRQVQLQEKRPDLIFNPLRGNIDTRIHKLKSGDYDAIVLAMAGLNRMGWTNQEGLRIQPLGEEVCLPAIAQAALGIECRQDDQKLLELLSSITHQETAICATIEREVLGLMNADCSFPIAALARHEKGQYYLEVMLADKAGKCHRVAVSGSDYHLLAKQAVDYLAQQGVVGPNGN